jgi:hypothetical protein
LNEAVTAGKVKAVPIDETTWEFTYWEPITPYITKQELRALAARSTPEQRLSGREL